MNPYETPLAAGGAHPSDEELADLLAENLDEGTADYLTAHVVDCVRCARLLSDAERAGARVRAHDPGPMPLDVMARLEAAFTAEAESEQLWAAEGFDARRSPRADPGEGLRPRPVVHERGAAPGMPRLSGRGRGPQTTRRQAREEADGSLLERLRARLPSPPEGVGERVREHPWLVAAVSVLVLVLGGGVAVRSLGGPSSDDLASSAASSADGAALARVTTSGTDYTVKGLDAQVRALVQADDAKAEAASQAQGTADDSAAPEAPAPTVSSQNLSQASGNTTLTDPEALRRCLQAIDAGDARPVAVDLGRYEGRDAALIVLPGRTGGYEVWAVARDCRPGADGTIVFRNVADS